MIKNNKLIMSESFNTLGGNWNVAIIITIIYIVAYRIIQMVVNMTISNDLYSLLYENMDYSQFIQTTTPPFIITLICGIVVIPLNIGYCRCFLALNKDNSEEWSNYKTIFRNYKVQLARGIYTIVLVRIYTFLWSLLFVVPGIIKEYSYSMTLFILAEDDLVTATDAIKRSQELMKGHKMKLFCLQLRFLGWAILSIMTFGIGFFWLFPYYMASKANFYEDVKASY